MSPMSPMSTIRAVLAAIALSAPLAAAATAQVEGPEVEVVKKLNENYFRSWREYDMDWFRKNLAEHFVLIAGDGSVIDKQGFVSFPSQRDKIREAHLEDVVVRVYPSGTAVVSANTVVDWKDGRRTATRYIDVYAKVEGRWQAVSAQLTADKHFKGAKLAAD